MELNGSNDDLCYNLAYECENLFVEILGALERIQAHAAMVKLCADFQQRFAIWTAHLGVFSRKSQCLDTRLRGSPDLQDLTARLLDLLRHCLYEWKDSTDHSRGEANEVLQVTLKGIDDTLSRLNTLGVTIRHSSSVKTDAQSKHLTQSSRSGLLTDLCMQAVESLYSQAPQALKRRLFESMKERCGRMLYQEGRNEELRARRQPVPPPLELIREEQSKDAISTNPFGSLRSGRAREYQIIQVNGELPESTSRFELSSMNTQRIRARNRRPDEASTKLAQTMSVQVIQGTYPERPTEQAGRSNFACEWCARLINSDKLTESEWHRHVDEDFKPYVCLWDGCLDGSPCYSTFTKWFEHMQLHDRRWYQKLYPTPRWVCTACDSYQYAFDTQQDLYAHLKQFHGNEMTSAELKIVARQSLTHQQRQWNICFVCSLTIPEPTSHINAGSKKRKGHSRNKKAKSVTVSSPLVGSQRHGVITGDGANSSSSESAWDADARSTCSRDEPEYMKDRARIVAEHIAQHLRVLMLLTLRFMKLEDKNSGDDGGDASGYSVKVNEENELESIRSKEQSLDTRRDIDPMPRIMVDAAKTDSHYSESQALLVPDSDSELYVPQQRDNLAAKEDLFLKGVIESGAYQSWRQQPRRGIPPLYHAPAPLEVILRSCAVLHADSNIHQRFWGYRLLKQILTAERIMEQLQSKNGGSLSVEKAARLCMRIIPGAYQMEEATGHGLSADSTAGAAQESTYLRIFTLLVMARKTGDTESFLVPQLSDDRIMTTEINIIEGIIDNCGWDHISQDIFQMYRRGVLVPYFATGSDDQASVTHLKLPEWTLLPWQQVESTAANAALAKSGGYGSVTKHKIDSYSHEFSRLLNPVGLRDDFVAVKSLNRSAHSDRRVFDNEVRMLKRFGIQARQTGAVHAHNRAHQHIVTLLVTYEIADTYCFLFPAAERDLEEYFKQTQGPLEVLRIGPEKTTVADANSLQWLSGQIVGLMAALNMIHGASWGNESQDAAYKYGRHGDLKAENILWFKSTTDERGILVIGDLGLADVHGEQSRSLVSNESLAVTMSQRAPEYDIGFAHINRSYDVWTMACVLLEIVAWALGGNARRETFSSVRMKTSEFAVKTDVFFDTFRRKDGRFSFTVKEAVKQSVREMHNMPSCTPYMHDLLDLVTQKMLRIHPGDRASTAKLLRALESMHERALAEPDYVIRASPGGSSWSMEDQYEERIADTLNPQMLLALERVVQVAKNMTYTQNNLTSTSRRL